MDLSGCYKNTPYDVLGLAAYFVANMSVCIISKANEGLTMINDDIAYISNIANITTGAPVSLDACLAMSNKTASFNCVRKLVVSISTTLVNAPMTVTNMVNNAYTFVNLFPTTLTVCATNTTFAAAVDGASIGLGVTSCIAGKIIGFS